MKQIVFFDGDGTLWYPKATKYAKKPHWVYTDPATACDPHKHLVLTPTAVQTINRLKRRGILLCVLSAHPHPPEEASRILDAKIRHFQLDGLFDEVHATRPYEMSKGEFMTDILARRGIPKKNALMVGDTYDWDYAPARQKGIDAVLIESSYRQEHPNGRRVRRTIAQLKDVLKYI